MLKDRAADLGITTRELNALLAVRDDLETGTIRPWDFAMNNCASCIGGHMARRMDGIGIFNAYNFVSHEKSPALESLFFPGREENPSGLSDYTKYNTQHAIVAIDKWLEGAEHPWRTE